MPITYLHIYRGKWWNQKTPPWYSLKEHWRRLPWYCYPYLLWHSIFSLKYNMKVRWNNRKLLYIGGGHYLYRPKKMLKNLLGIQ